MQNQVINAISNFATNYPHKTAVIDGSNKYTYKELCSAVNNVAQFISQKKIGIEDVVGILMDRSYNSICATLGTMKSGAAFLPIDKSIPRDRVLEMCRIAGVKLVLTDSSESVCDERFVALSNIDDMRIDDFSLANTCCEDQLAYVIFTSGSTGVPKGVMIEYAGMQNHLSEKIRILNMNEDSCVAFNVSISFDISIWQMLAPLIVGGKIVIFSNDDIVHTSVFCRKLVANAVTLLEVVPTYLNFIIDESQNSNDYFTDLKFVISTGEELNKTTVNRWFNRFKTIPIINAYGPTEASDDILHCLIYFADQYDRIPIGIPISNAKLSLKNKRGDFCKDEEQGELLVSGICVGRGYLGNAEETKKHFYFDKDLNCRVYRTGDIASRNIDGNYLFWGRVDNQVKFRGNRIELSEIEYAIERFSNTITKAIALFDKNSQIIKACFLATTTIKILDVKNFIRNSLPEYMIPSEIIQIDTLPFTVNGKIDRLSLLNLFKKMDNHKNISLSSNNNGIEENIARFISELLEITLPPNDDWKENMQAIGLDSLFVIKLILKIEDEYDFEFLDEDIDAKTVYNFYNLINCIKKNKNDMI